MVPRARAALRFLRAKRIRYQAAVFVDLCKRVFDTSTCERLRGVKCDPQCVFVLGDFDVGRQNARLHAGVCGTVLQGTSASAKSDVYSFGLTAVDILYGEPAVLLAISSSPSIRPSIRPMLQLHRHCIHCCCSRLRRDRRRLRRSRCRCSSLRRGGACIVAAFCPSDELCGKHGVRWQAISFVPRTSQCSPKRLPRQARLL